MILEIALLSVKPGMEAAFESAMREAAPLIAGNHGYIQHEVRRCLDDGKTHKYALLAQWATLEDHTVGFRQSPAYQQWRALLHHFYDPFPAVEHFGASIL